MVSKIKEYRAKRAKILKFLGGECAVCRATADLQIDHVDHTLKEFCVSENWWRSWARLEPELAKCQLLCAPHHLEKSKRDGSLKKGWARRKKPPVHGKAWTYIKYKCRCDACRLAKKESYR